uniref:Uncharacterized protein n=1 Tax=Anguilla anguilla TaxID=7936 RepID=A0A0E9Q2Y7_ANGAN
MAALIAGTDFVFSLCAIEYFPGKFTTLCQCDILVHCMFIHSE